MILGRQALLLGQEGEKPNRTTEADAAVSMDKPIRGRGRRERMFYLKHPRHNRDSRLVKKKCLREQLRGSGLV